jgi:hypothetical protein
VFRSRFDRPARKASFQVAGVTSALQMEAFIPRPEAVGRPGLWRQHACIKHAHPLPLAALELSRAHKCDDAGDPKGALPLVAQALFQLYQLHQERYQHGGEA